MEFLFGQFWNIYSRVSHQMASWAIRTSWRGFSLLGFGPNPLWVNILGFSARMSHTKFQTNQTPHTIVHFLHLRLFYSFTRRSTAFSQMWNQRKLSKSYLGFYGFLARSLWVEFQVDPSIIQSIHHQLHIVLVADHLPGHVCHKYESHLLGWIDILGFCSSFLGNPRSFMSSLMYSFFMI